MRMVARAALPAAACLWVSFLIAAPVALARGVAPAVTLAGYQSASRVCHQKAERSFAVSGAQMPVCARCLGLYVAGALGALAALGFGRGRRAPGAPAVRVLLSAAAAPMILSVGLEWIGAVQGSNTDRFLSALPLGLAAGWLIERTIADAAPRVAGPDAVSFQGL